MVAEKPDPKPGRGRIYDSITETIGDTPLVRMARMPRSAGVKADLMFKLEFFNPIGSVKDRIGVAMIDALERRVESRRERRCWWSPRAAIPALRSPSSPRREATI